MDVLVAYDVSTETKAGRRRLRHVAEVCKNYGQRVQNSVFECSLNATKYEQLVSELTGEIDPEEDSLRIYTLGRSIEECVETWGEDRSIDFDDPLIY